MKQEHFKLADDMFLEAFRSCSLQLGWFTHVAHLRIAFIYIKRDGLKMAIQNVCRGIKVFDESVGNGTKFHRTLTEASVQIVHHFIMKDPGLDFKEFLVKYPRLEYAFKGLLEAHYATETWSSEEAKLKFVLPDIAPF